MLIMALGSRYLLVEHFQVEHSYWCQFAQNYFDSLNLLSCAFIVYLATVLSLTDTPALYAHHSVKINGAACDLGAIFLFL